MLVKNIELGKNTPSPSLPPTQLLTSLSLPTPLHLRLPLPTRCTSVAEFEIEEGTRGLRYARVAPFEDEEEREVAAAAAAADTAAAGDRASAHEDGAGARTGRVRTADDVLGPELRELADSTSTVISA